MRLMLPILCSLITLAGCASFHQRDDAVYVGDPNDAVYDEIPESAWMKDCLAHQKPGGMCVEGVDVRTDRFEPVTVVDEKGDRYRFLVTWGWHGGRYGWVKKSDIAFPEDFKPAQHWTAASHWELCIGSDDCTNYDIEADGHFTERHIKTCSSGDCSQSGQLTEYQGIYQFQNNPDLGPLNYLIPVEGKGLCWAHAWMVDQKCVTGQ